MMADDSPAGDERTLYVCNHHKQLSCPKAHCAYCGRGDCFATENTAMAQWHNNKPMVCYSGRKWADDHPCNEPTPEPETDGWGSPIVHGVPAPWLKGRYDDMDDEDADTPPESGAEP